MSEQVIPVNPAPRPAPVLMLEHRGDRFVDGDGLEWARGHDEVWRCLHPDVEDAFEDGAVSVHDPLAWDDDA